MLLVDHEYVESYADDSLTEEADGKDRHTGHRIVHGKAGKHGVAIDLAIEDLQEVAASNYQAHTGGHEDQDQELGNSGVCGLEAIDAPLGVEPGEEGGLHACEGHDQHA